MKTKNKTSWMRSIDRMGLKAAFAALIIATPAFANPSGETLEAIAPGAEPPRGDTPDFTKHLSPLALDLATGFKDWKQSTQNANIVYGDWYTTGGGGGGFLCGGGGGSTTVVRWQKSKIVKSSGFSVESIGSGASAIRLSSVEPFVPSGTPKVRNTIVLSQLTSPLIDLSINKQDRLKYEYSMGTGFSFQVMLSTDAGRSWQIIRHEYSNGSNGFLKSSINLEQVSGLRLRQTRKAQLRFVFNDTSGRLIGSKKSKVMLRNIITPPLYQESLELIGKSERLRIERESDSLVTLRWNKGVLESAPSPDGPWNRVENAESPYPLIPDTDMDFFRLRARVEGD